MEEKNYILILLIIIVTIIAAIGYIYLTPHTKTTN